MNDADCCISVPKFSLKRIQFICLFVAVIFECLMIFIGKMNGRILYKPFHNALLICSFLFVGTVILQAFHKKRHSPFLLPTMMACWFTIIQLQHYSADMTLQPYGMFLSSYLLAFPFASVTQDSKKQFALKTVAFLYIAATLILVVYTFLLVTDCIPAFLSKRLFWNSARLTVLHHPNITARAFMISFIFCLGFVAQFSQRWVKGLFLTAAMLSFFALSLTNSRSIIILTCFLCAGCVFFAIFKVTLKQLVCGFVACVAAALCLFWFSQALFQWNKNRLEESALPKQSHAVQMADTQGDEFVSENDPLESTLSTQSTQIPSESQITPQKDSIISVSEPLPVQDGIVAEDGALYYYENGVRTYAGLIQIDGDYYYVNSKCIVVTGRYTINKTNGLMEKGTYLFDETGKLLGEAAGTNTTAEQNSIKQDLPTLNGRTKIWKITFEAIMGNPKLLLHGCDNTARLVGEYGANHTHNSWLEILVRLGLPAFLICVLFTLQALRASIVLILHRGADLWKKTVAMLEICLLASGFIEPNLFFTEEVWHYVDFIFFLCLGYLIAWSKQLTAPADDNE